MALLILSLCFWFSGLTQILAAVPSHSPSEHLSCKGWDNIAATLSQSTGAQQQCWSNGTEPCTRIDCAGAYEYNADHTFTLLGNKNIEVDYCFGIILNHCDEPISLDFYIQVPAKEVNRTTRIYHNTLLSIPGLNYSLESATAQGFLYFQMNRVSDTVTFSITVKVRVDIGILSSWPLSLQRRLITDETVPVPPCPPGASDVSDIPALGQCHPPSWQPGGSAQPKPLQAGALFKKCSENNHCQDDPWLMCNLENDTCICSPQFESWNNTSCKPRSRYGQSCVSDDECNIEMNEICRKRNCTCQGTETFDTQLHMCIHPMNLRSSTAVDTDVVTKSPAPHAGEDSPSKLPEQNIPAVIAGSVIGGVLVLAGLLTAAYFALRRLRRPYSNGEMLLEDDGEGSM